MHCINSVFNRATAFNIFNVRIARTIFPCMTRSRHNNHRYITLGNRINSTCVKYVIHLIIYCTIDNCLFKLSLDRAFIWRNINFLRIATCILQRSATIHSRRIWCIEKSTTRTRTCTMRRCAVSRRTISRHHTKMSTCLAIYQLPTNKLIVERSLSPMFVGFCQIKQRFYLWHTKRNIACTVSMFHNSAQQFIAMIQIKQLTLLSIGFKYY